MEIANSPLKTPDDESDTPAKQSPFTNGVLKRHVHAPLGIHHPVVVTYGECLKNHAAALGGHAVDGCGEFMPSTAANPADPSSLKCGACGCHRNFHRREPDDQVVAHPGAGPALEYRSHHRHLPLPPPPQPHLDDSGGSPNNSPSPPPISSSYFPTAPNMLIALTHGLSAPVPRGGGAPLSVTINAGSAAFSAPSNRKRFRTKFTQDQKEKMLEFAEKLGWKMQKRDDGAINEFCSRVAVDKSVFKVWMHNNKHMHCKKDHLLPTNSSSTAVVHGGLAGITFPLPAQSSADGSFHNQRQAFHQEETNESKETISLHHFDTCRSQTFETNGPSS